MRSALVIAGHDLRRALSDRGGLFFMFMLPVVFATFFGLVMGGGSQPADVKVKLTVIDEDHGFLARALIEELEGERLALVEMDPAAASGDEDRIRTLVIPSGFTATVTAGEKATLRLEREPDSSMEASLVVQARILAASARVIGRLIATFEQTGGIDAESLAMQNRAEDLVQVETSFAGRARKPPSGFTQSIPGNVVMFVLLVSLTYGAATLSAERAGGQLRRLGSAPLSPSELILGKILGRLAIASSQIVVLMLVALAARTLLHVDTGANLPAQLVILLAYAVAVAPLGVALGAFFHDPDHAANVGVLITLAMAAFGGCWWPLEVVSEPLQKVALLLPTGWAMTALHDVISFGRGLAEVTTSLLVLLGFAVAFTLLAVRSLRIS